MDDLLDDNDACGVADAVRRGDVTAREVLDATLARCAERNPVVNAVTELRVDGAHADLGAGGDGPLAGVPFVVKDLGVDVAGMRSTSGSRLFADRVAPRDSTLVERYKAAGLVIIGTTNTAEFGRSPSTEPLLHGPARNPHDLTRSAGGSSGGTAAAVAAGIVPAGHGNDGGGSIRIPASACGLVGLKPSRGRTPAHPRRVAFAYPAGINHVLTRTVRDTAALLDVAAGPVAGDAYLAPRPDRPYAAEVGADPGRCRVALSTTPPSGVPVDAEAVAAVEALGRMLERLGHHVEQATPPYPTEAIRLGMQRVMSVPLALEIDAHLAAVGRELRDDDLEPFTAVLYRSAKAVTGTELVAGLQAVEEVGLALGSFFERFDVLVTPTLPGPPLPLGTLDTTDVEAMYRHAGPVAAFAGVFNLSGQPAISLPVATYADGMPLGVQLVAGFGREDLLLRLASQVEAAEPWPITPVWPASG